MTFSTKTISLATAALLLSAPIALAQDSGSMMKKSEGGAMMKKSGSGSNGMMMKKSAPATGTGESKGTATGGNAGGQAGRS